MASETDIANLAIARLGSAAVVTSISPPDGSAIAAKCALFYPMMRDALLEMRGWPFAVTRAALSELADATIPPPYTNAYAMPSNCMVPIDIRHADANDDSKPNRLYWETQTDGSKIVFTDTELAVMRYKIRQTDTTKFTPLFIDALAWLLAAQLAGQVLGNDVKVANRCYQMFQAVLGAASSSTFMSVNAPVDHTPSWIGAR